MTDTVSGERLVRLGLTLYEARAYVALVSRDASTPAEVARLAGVPRPRIRDVLESLMGKGLAADRPGHTAKYVATPPDQAAAQLIQVHREHVTELEDDARGLVDELRPAYLAGQQHTDPLDYIEVLRSSEAVARKFDELQRTVEREMLVFSKAPAAANAGENLVGPQLARRHVLRSMYEYSVLEEKKQLGSIRALLDAGEEARFIEELPMELGIIDERTVLVAMPNPAAGRDDVTTLVIENPHLARILKIGFESVWTSGMTFAQARRRLGIKQPGRRGS